MQLMNRPSFNSRTLRAGLLGAVAVAAFGGLAIEGLPLGAFPAVAEVAGFLAPMPGGVGPMTRAMLLVNVVEAAERELTGS